MKKKVIGILIFMILFSSIFNIPVNAEQENNDITNLNEYIALVEDWLEFYNTKRLKNKRR